MSRTPRVSNASSSQGNHGSSSSSSVGVLLPLPHAVRDGEIVRYTAPSSMTGFPTIRNPNNTGAATTSTTTTTTLIPFSTGPSGSMKIDLRRSMMFPGGGNSPTIEISYRIPSGIQRSYHYHPGVAYSSTQRYAYLPHTDEGRRLLSRFKFAFVHGYMFTIGQSFTTGWHDQVTWTTIPNKSSLRGGGPFAFPDPNYIQTANQELDRLGIPSADACYQHYLVQQQQQQQASSQQAIPSQVVRRSRRLQAQQQQQQQSNSRNVTSMTIPNGVSQSSRRSHHHRIDEIIHYTAPTSLGNSASLAGALQPYTPKSEDEECSICLDSLKTTTTTTHSPVLQISSCNHAFHSSCLYESLNHHIRCPICRTPVGNGTPPGKSPSGTLQVSVSQLTHCPGFGSSSSSAIVLTYNIPPGIQQTYHEHPGTPYSGAHRVAYLPHSTEGIALLQRLKYAWKHGLIFRIGTSLTSGRANQVTWTSIHHKTSLHGGPHGFPDPNYITNCNAALDALHVPKADQCHG